MTGKRKRYRKRPGHFVTAVRLNLDMPVFHYKKWGGHQRCKPGDWLVNNDGDTYTVAAHVFMETYEELSPGVYQKCVVVLAERADAPGTIKTIEGITQYEPGDYLVHNREDGSDSYAVARVKFEEMYESIP